MFYNIRVDCVEPVIGILRETSNYSTPDTRVHIVTQGSLYVKSALEVGITMSTIRLHIEPYMDRLPTDAGGVLNEIIDEALKNHTVKEWN